MSDKIRIGVIGTGQIGTRHLERYAAIPDAEVVAICDLREDAARGLAHEFGIPDVYTDYRQMLERKDIQSVDVCLHNRLPPPDGRGRAGGGQERATAKSRCPGPTTTPRRCTTRPRRTGNKLHIQLGTIYSPRGARRAQAHRRTGTWAISISPRRSTTAGAGAPLWTATAPRPL